MAKKPEKETVEQSNEPSVVTVKLNGTSAQKTGEHGVYANNKLVVMFHDGVAEVKADVAKLLKELGFAE